ncbi:MAG TPA: response regulator [Candidatus Binatia bacterium]|nr:response regulator [Candidatus Binatia bacterium]
MTAAASGSRQVSSPKDAQTVSRKKPVVLLVEDDSQMRQIFMLLMKRLRVQAVHAASAEEGLLKARELGPAVIVTDINLPGLSGLQMIAQLKADPATAHVPVVAWSGNSDYQQPSLRAGAVDFISKSEKNIRLVQRVQEILNHG